MKIEDISGCDAFKLLCIFKKEKKPHKLYVNHLDCCHKSCQILVIQIT
jgi:hypothetical protein